MEKIRCRIYVEGATNEIMDELYDKFPELDFFYRDKFLRFHGSPERLQEILRFCDAEAIKTTVK